VSVIASDSVAIPNYTERLYKSGIATSFLLAMTREQEEAKRG